MNTFSGSKLTLDQVNNPSQFGFISAFVSCYTTFAKYSKATYEDSNYGRLHLCFCNAICCLPSNCHLNMHLVLGMK